MTPWVLLRGLTREVGHWGAFTAQLAQAMPGAPVVALDLPGTGRLHRMRSPLRVETIAEFCREALRAQSPARRYRLLGLSLGGMVATAWAARWPEEVAACVLVNTSLRPFSAPQARLRPGRLPTLLSVLAARDARRAEQTVLRLSSSFPERHQGVLDEWVAIRHARPVSTSNAVRQLIAAAVYRHPGPAPSVPVLVATGACDALVDPACSAALAHAWGVQQLVRPHAGHDLPLDAGPWLAARIAAWAAATERGPG